MEEEKLTTEKPLVYEETPIIEPADVAPKPKASSKFPIQLVTVVFFILLFFLGVWLSTVIRQFIPANVPVEPTPAPTETPIVEITPLDESGPFAGWRRYEVVSGATKQPISGIWFRLPPDVLAPICDGANCSSQGTYLPGGTRFTIAPRGGDQVLRDFRGAVVTDAGGREFTTTPTTVAGKTALEFSGLFTGTTGGGYSFSQMRGVMIEVDSTLSLEINHFTPTGVSADFASDDALFNEILKTLVLAPI